jgi:hypothetical protein
MSLYKSDSEVSHKPWLRIVNGKFVRNVPEGTPGAVARQYTPKTADGKEGTESKTVYELQYPAIEGYITGAEIVTDDRTKRTSLNLTFTSKTGDESAIFTTPFPGRIADSVICYFPVINLSKPVLFNVGREEKGATVKNFIWMTQDGVKLNRCYTRSNPLDCPPITQKTVAGVIKYNSDDRDEFLYQVACKFIESLDPVEATSTPQPVAERPRQAADLVTTDEADDDVPF